MFAISDCPRVAALSCPIRGISQGNPRERFIRTMRIISLLGPLLLVLAEADGKR